jgi:hypothetical protein
MPMPSTPLLLPARWRSALLLCAGLAVGLGLLYGPCTQDDAFISFRYAQNLVEGHGLVYNPGERVEGFTNLLWTLLLAVPLALGLDPVAASTAMGLAAAGLAVLTTGLLAARLLPERAGPAAALAGLLLAADPQAALEAVEGLETSLHMAIVAVVALRLGRELAGPLGPRAHLGSGALLAVLCLSRPEAPLLAAGLHFGLIAGAARRGTARAALVRAVVAAGPAVLLVLGLTAFRLAYYGEPLPNTFYAKTGGAALERGLGYLAVHLQDHPVQWGAAVIGLVALRGRPLGQALAGATLAQLAYVAWVGGDFKPTGRFVMPVLPLMAALGAAGLLQSRPLGRPRVLALLGAALVVRSVQVYGVCAEWADIRHANMESRRTLGLFLRDSLPPDTLIAIHSAGAVPYYAGLPTIDMWGLTDHHIARAPVPDFGQGMAGHERGDPAYVFGREPALYLPEDKMFVLRAIELQPEPGFPADFEEKYQSISIPVEGRVLNCWVRKGFLRTLHGGPSEGLSEPG